jgi:glyoxylase-like metal-dependent hydrolase (beta-lactamase superfamily II)
VFTLEALQANDGDCLLLHYGTEDAPKHILIDGGPKTIYKSVLKPRLDELRGARALNLRMVMVSHIDLDHITGVLDLSRAWWSSRAAESRNRTASRRCGTTASRSSA